MKTLLEMLLEQCNNKRFSVFICVGELILEYPMSNAVFSEGKLKGFDFVNNIERIYYEPEIKGFCPLEGEEEKKFIHKIKTKKESIKNLKEKFQIEYKHNEDLLYYNSYIERDCRLMYLFNVSNVVHIYRPQFIKTLKNTMAQLICKTVDHNVDLLEKERKEFVGKNENYTNEEIDFIKDALLEVKNNINLNYETPQEIIEYGWPSILAPNILIF